MEAKIKPQDIRYNNLVEFEGKYLPVLAIDTERECKELGLKCAITIPEMFNGRRISTVSTWLNNINPIELSEDWLRRMGFEEIDGLYSIPLKATGTFLVIKPLANYYWIEYSDAHGHVESVGLGGIKSVHEAMNLYYSLTGSELTIKDINNIEVK